MPPSSDSEDPFQVVSYRRPTRLAKKKRMAEKALSSQSASDSEPSFQPFSTAQLVHQAVGKLEQAILGETDTVLKGKLVNQVQNLHKILLNEDLTSESGSVEAKFSSLQLDVQNKFAALQSSIEQIAAKVAKGAEVKAGCCHGQTDMPPKPVPSEAQVERSYAQVTASSGGSAGKGSTSKTQTKKARGPAHMSPGHGKHQNPTQSSKPTYRERRLILANSKGFTLVNALELRNKLNSDFTQQLKTQAPVIAAITKSQKNDNVILVTTDSYSADFLLQNKQVWQKHFDSCSYTSAYKDKEWYKVIAHGIPTEIFNFVGGMELLKQEIEIFNSGLSPIAVNWISSAENRASKMHGSVVLSFDSKEMAAKALKQRLLIAGIPVRTAQYEVTKSNEQCQKCQKLGHVSNSCKNRPVCQFCAQNHITRLHRCNICAVIGQICAHTVLKCANCSGNHRANSTECEMKGTKGVSSNTSTVTTEDTEEL